ncbi:MAG: hypothetical protein ACRD21_09275 [Vicinamibacteria bacterium]
MPLLLLLALETLGALQAPERGGDLPVVIGARDSAFDETDWIRGIYGWKWPTDLDLGGSDPSGFTPNGKPAEEVLHRWYRSRLQ